MIPKKMLDFRIKVAGVRKIWYSKYLWLNYLILTFAVLLSLFFVRMSVFNNAKEMFNERASSLFNYLTLDKISTLENIIYKIKDFNNLNIGNFKDNLGIVLIDSDSKILFKSKIFDRFKNIDNDLDLNLCKKVENNVNIVKLGKVSEELISVSKRIKSEKSNHILGYVIFFSDTKSAKNSFLKLSLYVLVIFFITVFLFYFINRYFRNFIASQIDKVSKVARCIALGDFKTRILKTSKDELGELCDTINYMAQKLSESERMKNDFISSISHELRTPLTAIKGWAETIKIDENAKDAKINKKGLKIIANESERLYNIVEDLLDFSKLQSARTVLNLEKIDVLAELSESVYILRKKAEDENKILLYTEPESLPAVLGDKKRLKQIFINIIDNAIKYTVPTKGVININAKEDKDFIKITISDNGSGISKEDLPKVKNKFYKGNNQKAGSGIGLAIANELVLLHSGKLEIKSEKNIGTIVYIFLPISL